MSDRPSSAAGQFPATDWGQVQEAARRTVEFQRPALEQLLRRYLPALRAHLVRRKGVTPDEAEDLVQGFVQHAILEHGLIGRADPAKGKFRTLLLTALDRYRIDQLRRRPPVRLLGDAQGLLEPVAPQARPEDQFDVAWAREVLAEALLRMKQACEASKRPDIWAVFECRLLAPMLEGAAPTPYEVLVERFGLRTPLQASNLVMTAKRAFGRALRSVLGEYAADDAAIDQEVLDLHAALERGA